MNLLNKLQNQYDQLWKLIIRPSRTTYPQSALGPQTFILQNKKVKRIDFQLINRKGKVFFGSHFVPMQQDSYPCVIYMHGNSSNRTEGMEYLSQLIRRNISLCTFDFTGCGNAQGQYVTLGYYQWQDLHEVVQWVKHKQKVTSIGIWGRSMGAVTGLLYLKKSEYISVGVFDSPFKSLKSLIQDLVKKNSKIPMWVLAGALKIISSTIQEKADFDIYKLNPLKNEVPFVKHPAFFIVGSQDELIPCTHTQQLFAAYKGKIKQIRLVSGGHNDQRPDHCINDAIDFLSAHLKKKKSIKVVSEQIISKQRADDLLSSGLKQTLNGKNKNSPKKSKNAVQQVDFFAEQVKGNTNEKSKINNFSNNGLLDDFQFQKMQQDQTDDIDIDAYKKFEQMKEMPVQDIDFFGQGGNEINSIDFQGSAKIQSSPKQKEKGLGSNLSSLTSMFSNMMTKTKVFGFGGNKTENELSLKSQKKSEHFYQDKYDLLRQKISSNFKMQQSDMQQKKKMQKTQDLGRIIKQQSKYQKFSRQNQDKIDSWVFV